MEQPLVPFTRPRIIGQEAEYVAAAMCSEQLCGDGAFTRKASELLERDTGVSKALLTTSCTHALEMCALLLREAPGDEVIVPSFTFVSTANAFALHGWRPVFADVREDTLNIDETRIEKLITPRTRAIIVVHYSGVACEMDRILEIGQKHGIRVVEDNAHGLYGKYKGRYLGSLGCLATLSFHHTKNFSSGEGGALLINDGELLERAEIIREKGTNRSRFFRGQVDKYTWVDLGSSYLPSELNAAYLLGQLEARDAIQARRRAIWERYFTAFSKLKMPGIGLPTIPAHCEQAYHLFYLMMPSLKERTEFIQFMLDHRVSAPFHYVPLNTSPMGIHFGGSVGQCPVTESVSDRLVRLPLFHDLREDELGRVIQAVEEYFQRK